MKDAGRVGLLYSAGVSADRGELTVLAGLFHHHHGTAGRLAGIIVFLFATHTTLSVPALMGAVMCMGVATANSILVITFAKDTLAQLKDPVEAAIEAGYTRFRPVLMTALAMIIGMIPMALGMGDGGEQNAPLGRAVIGGLLFATVSTLMFVPSVFALLHKRQGPADELPAAVNQRQPVHA